MTLLNVSKLNKAYGEDVILKDVSFNVASRDKIGFVGVNGAGKTTLFKALLNSDFADSGEIFTNKETVIGYMQQHADIHSDKTVLDEVMEVYSDMAELEDELERISHAIEGGDGDIDTLIHRQASLTAQFENRGGYTYQSIAKSSLIGLGFDEKDFPKPFEALSGGQKTRVSLCKILLSNANLLLLDEPTNHLDIASVEWLENFLINYSGSFIIISHDRYFLDRVCNKTIELENSALTEYNGNYTRYLALKEEARTAAQRKYDNTMREIKRVEGIIEQQRRWNREKNIKTAESKQKVVDRLEETLQKPDDAPDSMHFRFHINKKSGNDVLTANGLAAAYGIHKVFSGIDMDIKKNERVFLLGENGCGKTTLLKILTGTISPIDGEFKLGANVELGYYDQAQENLDYSKTVLDEIYDAYPKMSLTQIRNALASFLFVGDDVFKTISSLSGGERAKVSLLKLMLSGANMLFLDEPTNHLDISSREALETALLGYEGTLLIVSHDRYFINKLADKVMYMRSGSINVYNGNYDYFTEKFKAVPNVSVEKKLSKKEDYLDKKRAEAEKRKNASKLERTEKRITELEGEIDEKNQLLLTDEYATDYVKASELSQEIAALEDELSELYSVWEDVMALIEQ